MTENSEGIASERKRNFLCTVLFFFRSQPNIQSFPTVKFVKIRKNISHQVNSNFRENCRF